jgi:hypothetical protein
MANPDRTWARIGPLETVGRHRIQLADRGQALLEVREWMVWAADWAWGGSN